MQRQVSSWVAVFTILLVLIVIAGVYWLLWQRRGNEIPEGFKPQPPQFKAVPYEEGQKN